MAKMVRGAMSDGTQVVVRTRRTIAGTFFDAVVPSRPAAGVSLMRLDGRMFLILHGSFVPVEHPDYRYAGSDAAGADVALRFCVDSGNACIDEAAREGVSVEQMY